MATGMSVKLNKVHLWLDDERDPTLPEIKNGFGSIGDEIWVKTVDECIKILKSGLVESISLDHDLGSPENGTGYDVALWIEESAYNKQIPPISTRVHSANPVGRKNMESALINAKKYWKKWNYGF